MRKTILMMAVVVVLMAAPGLGGRGFRAIAGEAVEPVAVLLSVSGDVRMTVGGVESAAAGRTLLHYGDVVSPGKGGAAVLLYRNGKKVSVRERHAVSKDAEKIESANSGRVRTATGILFNTLSGKNPNADLSAMGGTSGGLRIFSSGEPEAIEPFISLSSFTNTTIMDDRPQLYWESSAADSRYLVSLLADDGAVMYSTLTIRTALDFPADKPSLARGKSYKLDVMIEGMPDSKVFGVFNVLDDAGMKDVAESVKDIESTFAKGDDLVVRYMLLAELYMDKGLYANASNALAQLKRADPGSIPYVMRRSMAIHSLTKPKTESEKAMENVFGGDGSKEK